MNLSYGKGNCNLNVSREFETVKINYQGKIVVKHNFFEITGVINNKLMIANKNKKDIFIQTPNQILIKFKKSPKGNKLLFKYNGEMKINSVQIDNQNISVSTENIDLWGLIDSDWDQGGLYSKYKYTYFVGKVPNINRRKLKISNGKLSSTTTSSRGSSTGSTSSRGGY